MLGGDQIYVLQGLVGLLDSDKESCSVWNEFTVLLNEDKTDGFFRSDGIGMAPNAESGPANVKPTKHMIAHMNFIIPASFSTERLP